MITVPVAADDGAPAADPVVQRYRAFFALLDWTQVPERRADRPWPGQPPHPRAAYVKALLVKLCEGKPYITQLRTFLVEHPPLVRELGFCLVGAPERPEGFDVERTVPGARWLRHQQQTIDDALLRGLLRRTVPALQAEIPDMGTTVAADVKHIYAWVQENNPKAFVAHRFDPQRQPRGDPDCRLGVKRRSNQTDADGATPGPAECLWGYGTGIISTTTPADGDVVLAEWTQPFNANDVTYYQPLWQATGVALGYPPTNVAADAAFDAWHVYHSCAGRGGIAAIPLNTRGQPPPDRTADGVPRCAIGRPMAPLGRFTHQDGYQAQRYGCPLLHPQPTGEGCAHPQFAKGPGCTKVVNLEAGGRMRVELDRHSAAFAAIYRQRTSAERINSQATALGIERPRVRNGRSLAHLNTLTYIIINARALQRARVRRSHEPPG
jgi:hypothetical protein